MKYKLRKTLQLKTEPTDIILKETRANQLTNLKNDKTLLTGFYHQNELRTQNVLLKKTY